MPDENIYNEPLLLKKISDGDQKAFQKLFISYWGRVYSDAMHFLKSPEAARDLSQEVFMRIWLSREKLSKVKHFESYLYRVSKNLFLDHLRKQLINTHAVRLKEIEIENNEPDAQQQIEFSELETQIRHAIAFLPAQMQKAFRLSRFYGLTHEEIAHEMNISKVTSQNYIARSLVIIRKYLLQHLSQVIILLELSGKIF